MTQTLCHSLLTVAVTNYQQQALIKRRGLGYRSVVGFLPGIYRALDCGGFKLHETLCQKVRRKKRKEVRGINGLMQLMVFKVESA